MAMPPAFSAPIPIYNDFHQVREIDDAAVRDFIAWISREMSPRTQAHVHRLLTESPLPDKKAIAWARRRLGTLALALSLRGIRSFAYQAAQSSRDALVVDDFFLLLLNPEVQDDLASFLWRKELAQGIGRHDARRHLVKAVSGWVEGRGRSYPGLRAESAAWTVISPSGNPLCWHAQEHARLRRRGPKFKLERRAATWGTYVVAWLVGSETLAVRLWNRLLLPAGYRWGRRDASAAYALSKYADAKARLIHDLRVVGGRGLVPERSPLRPFPPLDPATAFTLEGQVGHWTQLELSIALGGLLVQGRLRQPSAERHTPGKRRSEPAGTRRRRPSIPAALSPSRAP